MKSNLIIFVCFLFVLVSVSEAQLLVENFDYTANENITDNNWITQMSADTQIIPNIDLIGQGYWQVVSVHPNGDNVAAYTVTDDTGVTDPSAETNLHTYTVVGTYSLTNHVNQGQVIIAMGYKKRF